MKRPLPRLFTMSLAFTAAISITDPAQAQSAEDALTPAGTLDLYRDDARVTSGQEFFHGATYIGSEACGSCHVEQHEEWSRTWHAKMERWPSEDVVVGDFNDRVITYKDVVVKSEDGTTEETLTVSVKTGRDGDEYTFTVLDADNPDNNQTYVIAKVLGGKWDQHYEILLGENYLPAPIRWNVTNGDWLITSYRPHEWFFADGTPDGRPRVLDELPKNRVAEAKCSGCHTTGYEFKPDPVTNVWMAHGNGELGIACEQCHGPGSKHQLEAQEASAANMTLMPGTSTIVHPLTDLNANQQTQICAQCHGRNTNKKIKDIAFQQGFRPGDSDMTSRARYWNYSGTSASSEYKYFYPNDWAKRNRQQFQDFTKSAHFNKAGMSCLTCHTFHGDWEEAQLRLEPQALCTSCHSEEGIAHRPNTEMFEGSPMQVAGVQCVDCHMAKIGYRSNKTANGPHPWDVSSHTFMVSTPALEKSDGLRTACVSCHNEDGKVLDHVAADVEAPQFTSDDLHWVLLDNKDSIRRSIGEIQSYLANVDATDEGAVQNAGRAQALVNFVVLDGSMGAHNSQKALDMLDEALGLARSAAE